MCVFVCFIYLMFKIENCRAQDRWSEEADRGASIGDNRVEQRAGRHQALEGEYGARG